MHKEPCLAKGITVSLEWLVALGNISILGHFLKSVVGESF